MMVVMTVMVAALHLFDNLSANPAPCQISLSSDSSD
jgi:hypothetical protein